MPILTSGELTARRQSVLTSVLTAMVALAMVTVLVQLAASAEAAWIAVDVGVGLTFYALLRTARAGRIGPAAAALVGLFGALTVMLLLADGPDHPMWAMLSAFTVVLAALLLGGRGGLVALGCLGTIVLVIVLLQVGPLSPADAEESGEGATVVELVILLGVLGWIFRVYTHTVLTPAPAAPANTPAPAPSQVRTLALTPREVEVVCLIAEGRSNDAIAAHLVVSPRTVHSHVTNAMRKCGCGNRTELGVLAVREGLVPLTPSPAPARARTP